MTRQRFYEILREYQVPDERIEILWKTRPGEKINEMPLRLAIEMTIFLEQLSPLAP